MKSTLEIPPEQPKPPKEIKFPVLARSTDSTACIILFISEDLGIALQHSADMWKLSITKWISVSDTTTWQILPNDYKLILQNDQ